MVRSKTKLIENIEKLEKFFYTAGKQPKQKKLTPFKNKNGEKKTTWRNIINSKGILYSDIYKKAQRKGKNKKIISTNILKKQKSNNWHTNLTKPFEENELFHALKSMKKANPPEKMEFQLKFILSFGAI